MKFGHLVSFDAQTWKMLLVSKNLIWLRNWKASLLWGSCIWGPKKWQPDLELQERQIYNCHEFVVLGCCKNTHWLIVLFHVQKGQKFQFKTLPRMSAPGAWPSEMWGKCLAWPTRAAYEKRNELILTFVRPMHLEYTYVRCWCPCCIGG